MAVLERDTLGIREVRLFSAVVRWSEAECQRQQLQVTPENKRKVLGKALALIRFPLMTIEEFAAGDVQGAGAGCCSGGAGPLGPLPVAHQPRVGPRAPPGTQVCPSVLTSLFSLMGSWDCAQTCKHGTTPDAVQPARILVSPPSVPPCPHADVCVCQPLGVPISDSHPVGPGFSVLDKPVKGWEMARVVVTLLRGLGFGPM